MRLRSPLALVLASAATLALAACGTTEAPAAEDTAPAAEQIVLTDATGEEVTLDGPATSVIATEWNVTENLLSLGVEPVGVADTAGYRAWSSAVPLTGDATDIGTRGEPSLDTIASLAPDLVVATTDLPADAVAQLQEIAPVLVVRSASGTGQVDQAFANLDLIARATGTEDAAATVEADYQAAVEAGAAALAEAGLAGQPIAFSDGYAQGNLVTLRPYTATSLIGEVNTALGLTNAWAVEGDADYGLASSDVEGLTQLPAETRFAYISNAADGTDEYVAALEADPIWESLPFVQAGRVERLPDGIWMFGGPASMQAYTEALVASLTA